MRFMSIGVVVVVVVVIKYCIVMCYYASASAVRSDQTHTNKSMMYVCNRSSSSSVIFTDCCVRAQNVSWGNEM
jgi:hypothetical protein